LQPQQNFYRLKAFATAHKIHLAKKYSSYNKVLTNF